VGFGQAWNMTRIAATVFYLIGLGLAEAARVPRRIDRVRARRTWHVQDGGSRIPEYVVMAAVALGIWLLPITYAFTGWLRPLDYAAPQWTSWLATGVLAASLAIRWKAQLALGRHWSCTLETADEHRLVTGGIYAYVRHPLYASLVLWAAAQPFLLQNVLAGWGGGVAVALIWLIRVPREEKMMLQRFGEEYRSYAARTGRLFPRFTVRS
jgi:protein-S-isoprenylcysteine O-methyltransferase Ste14